MSRGVVVGVDGSPGSNHALAWAAARTERFGPIRPVVAWRYPVWAVADPTVGGSIPAPTGPEIEALARRRADDALAAVPADRRDPLVVCSSSAGPALVEVGVDANLIVVGTRGRGALADGLLGSVSCHVVNHATVPAAVVPAEAPLDDPHRRVIVGIDGSDTAIDALAWTLRFRPADDTVVEAMHVWNHLATAVPMLGAAPVNYTEAEAVATLEQSVALARERADQPGAEVSETLVYGDPRSVLRTRSAEADLLVVGSRGHRGVLHLLLGSVTTGLVHQPLTTTLVVPSAD